MRHYLHGLGLKQEPFGPALSFSSSADPSVGTIDDLTARVGKMITAAEALDLPDEPPLPALTIRAPSQLGTVTKQRQQLGEAALNEANSKKAKWAEEIRVERATGKSKKRNGARAARQPRRAAMPTIEALVEQRIEILFRCGFDVIAPPAKSKGKGKGKKMPPKVKRVSEVLWCAGDDEVRGEAQQTQLAMSLVLHRTPGIGSPRDFIRFSRCQFRRILNRSGFEGMFPQGWSGATADVRSLSWAVRPFHRFTKSHERY